MIRSITYSIGNRTYQRTVGHELEVVINGKTYKFKIAEIEKKEDVYGEYYVIWISNDKNELAVWKPMIRAQNVEEEEDNFTLLTF